MAEPLVPAPGGRRFATTRWSLVLAAGDKGTEQSADALATLCTAYWYPIYAFIRRQGHSPDDAADLTQAFFTRVLEKNYVKDADPARGRFRAFLCGSVRHFLSNHRQHDRALKRGGGVASISLEVETAEGLYQLEPVDDLTPERLMDRRWALTLLDRVLVRLRGEYAAGDKATLFDTLKGFLTGDDAERSYAEVATVLSMTEGAVKVAVHRLRRRYRDTLVAEITDTVSDPADVDAEIAHLLSAVRL